ncbi:MAG: prepilin-type N-terminal cleavage/methylation domain-containing protein [Candidatus Omnitrophica bacterium]|nr:prepilin-type N-terminal cleavage/methylation domain-containing protein [Candidatus Omnitrophota bacterium]
MQAQKSFTLIELLIVVAIIGILAAIAVPNFLSAQIRAKVARAEADMRNISTALESYRLDNNFYPPASLADGSTRRKVFDRYVNLTTPVAYMSTIPFDPFFERPDAQIPTIWGGPVYDYFERETSQLKTNPWGPSGKERNALYLIHSFGPDGENSALNVSDYYTIIPFDLSNGVASFGDIFRFGP